MMEVEAFAFNRLSPPLSTRCKLAEFLLRPKNKIGMIKRNNINNGITIKTTMWRQAR
jgi:hypothetical protein